MPDSAASSGSRAGCGVTQEKPLAWGQVGSGEQAKLQARVRGSRKDPRMRHYLLWDCSPALLHPTGCQLSLPFALAAKRFGGEDVTGEEK